MPKFDKILLVLDLDETLVHATRNPLFENWDFEVFDYKIFIRPGLISFLETCTNHFELGIWSSASDDYVKEVVERIVPDHIPLHFVWGRSRCTRKINYELMEDQGYYDPDNHLYFIKRLYKLKNRVNGGLERMLIVDDTPRKCMENYGNAIYPLEFDGNPEDKELNYLAEYLTTLANEKNVRTIEKRWWRKSIKK